MMKGKKYTAEQIIAKLRKDHTEDCTRKPIAPDATRAGTDDIGTNTNSPNIEPPQERKWESC